MGVQFLRGLYLAAAGLCLILASGCVSFRPVEPVMAPPSAFRGDATVPVEFVHPNGVGVRCAQRGTKFLALPGINSNACASTDLITMPNPCHTVTGGWYAAMLCHEIARGQGWVPAEEALAPHGAGSAAVYQPASFGGPGTSGRGAGAGEVRPPREFRDAATFAMEFVAADEIAYRCAERGAKLYRGGDAQAPSCADADLITVLNPCDAGGWFASAFCHELAHANGWPADHHGGRYLDIDRDAHRSTHASSPAAIAPLMLDASLPDAMLTMASAQEALSVVDLADPQTILPESLQAGDGGAQSAASPADGMLTSIEASTRAVQAKRAPSPSGKGSTSPVEQPASKPAALAASGQKGKGPIAGLRLASAD